MPERGIPDAIRTHGLTKRYGPDRGLFGLDLHVHAGEVFGYLGPNGAGKTTTIRLLMGLIRPDAGAAHVFGLNCQTQAVAVKRLIGYVPGELPDFGSLRGYEVVTYLGSMSGPIDQAHVRALSGRLDLDLGQPYRECSRGTKQKLALLLAFLHRPRLMVLDEPSGGLDPLNQQAFYALVREAKREGATVFLSSHILSEVEHICDRVGIVREGHLIEVASLNALRSIRSHRVEIAFSGSVPVDALRATEGVEDVSVEGARVRCLVRGSFTPLLHLLSNVGVETVSSHEPTLEETFLQHYATSGKG